MALTSQQAKLLRQILAQVPAGRPKIAKAATETAIVESNISNPSGGDADSAGWRQERASLYPDPTNVKDAARRFVKEAEAINHPGLSAGQLAALVQRPAAQYAGRYAQVAGQADADLRTVGSSGGATTVRGASPATGQAAATSSASGQDARRQLVLSYLLNRGQENPQTALLGLATGINDLPAAAPAASATKTAGTTTGSTAPSAILGRANAINSQHLPYHWGGGHASVIPAGTPLDCSGAVSKVLGIDPRVASQFETWGSPGQGKNVTIWAKDTHVIMEINGHFWGTSNSNPNGGAGWIPRSAISPSYLAGFTPRHKSGQ